MGKKKEKERSVGDILGARPVEIELGGRVYEVKPQVRAKARRFREACGLLFDGLDDIAVVANALADQSGKDNVPLEKVVVLIRELVSVRADAALDLIYLYDEQLDEDRLWIDNNATDEEMAVALGKILGLVFRPFRRVLPIETVLSSKRSGGAQDSG